MKYTYIFSITMSLVFLILSGCSTTLQKAQSEFDRAAYQNAIPLFKAQAEEKPDEALLAYYKLGECYRRSNRIEQALPHYEKALSLLPQYPDLLTSADKDTLQFYYAQALHTAQRYDEAKVEYEKYVQEGRTAKLKNIAQVQIETHPNLAQLQKPQPFVVVENLKSINSPASDFSPTPMGKENGSLIFSSARRNEKSYAGTGAGYYDLYNFSYLDSAQGTGSVAIWEAQNPNFNLEGVHESSATFSPDGKLLVFARSGKGKGADDDKEVSLYLSHWVENAWSEPQPLSYINSTAWDGTPFIAPDGKTLYFASNRASSKGGLDLYKATLTGEGANRTFTNAEKLPDALNTEGNEMFPTLDAAGNLYFASDGRGGLGGLDIFIAPDFEKQGEKAEIRNVGAPMNSSADDFGLLFTALSNNGKPMKGFLVSNRKEGSVGDDDIYRFSLDSLEMRFVEYYLRGITYLADVNTGTKTVLAGVNLSLLDEKGNTLFKTQSDASGKFLFDTLLVMDKNYTVTVGKEGYITRSAKSKFSTLGRGVDEKSLPQMYNTIYFDTTYTLTKDLLVTTTTDKGDILPPEITILYEYDKDRLTQASKDSLDVFVKFLNEYLTIYPDVELVFGSHTDERGSNSYNQKLSQRRANSAVNYLISKGVEKAKIKAVGYGEERPKVPKAKTEEEHQLNRRTTIEVRKTKG
ncbi:OmpA family protein [Hugenholtzia roseola]|uniref:OmpA family protein n=1 Tax=Hugenholtzia roseola TaxID=1002 RepID=UPI000478682F|nr:OmpA family protein [Hugenholtzia roseola]